jgi:hypothetical protein
VIENDKVKVVTRYSLTSSTSLSDVIEDHPVNTHSILRELLRRSIQEVVMVILSNYLKISTTFECFEKVIRSTSLGYVESLRCLIRRLGSHVLLFFSVILRAALIAG